MDIVSRLPPWAALVLLWMLTLPALAQDLLLAVSRTSLSLPLYVADAQGYFAAEGVQVQTRECIGGQRCLKQIFDGEVQLATASELPVMFNAFNRSDFAVVATFVTSDRDVKLVKRRNGTADDARQLEGKRIGTVKGTSAHYFLDSYLLFNDIDPFRIAVVHLAPERLSDALLQHEVDAVAVWEPYAYLTQKAVGADAVIMNGPRIYSETFNLIASRSLISTREDDLIKVLRAIDRAERFIRERPREAQAILKGRLQVEQGFIDATWNEFEYRLGLDQSLVGTLEGQARWAMREGHIPADRQRPNFLDFVESGPLRKAVPSAVSTIK